MLCAGIFRVRGDIYFWLQISVVLQDLTPRRPSLSNTATLENMLVVKHAHCHCYIYKAIFFFSSCMFSEKCNLKIGRGQRKLFRCPLYFFHCSPAAGTSCLPASCLHEPPGPSTSLCSGTHSGIPAKGWHLPGIKDNA